MVSAPLIWRIEPAGGAGRQACLCDNTIPYPSERVTFPIRPCGDVSLRLSAAKPYHHPEGEAQRNGEPDWTGCQVLEAIDVQHAK